MKADLAQRLSPLKIEMAPEVMDFQLEHVYSELQNAPRRTTTNPRRARRFVAIMTAALFAILPVGAGIAAENAIPGDALYPVKRTTEWLRGWVDDSVAADHRVDELETTLDRQAEVDVVLDRLRDAEDAVSDRPGDAPLNDRLDLARDRIRRDYPASDVPPVTDRASTDTLPTDNAPTDQSPSDSPPAETVTTDRPPDAPTGTATQGDATDRPSDGAAGDPPGDTAPATTHAATTTSRPSDTPPTTRGGDGDRGQD